MEDQDLIRMANQIAVFFQPYTDEEAIKGVAEHIAMFWEPRMRSQLLALAKNSPQDLSPIVMRALKQPSLTLSN